MQAVIIIHVIQWLEILIIPGIGRLPTKSFFWKIWQATKFLDFKILGYTEYMAYA